MPYLAFNLNDGNEFVFDLLEDRLSLGRDPKNDIVIDNGFISGHHAEFLRQEDGTYEVVDLKSSNGTFVNGKRVERSKVKGGDRILFGRLESRYRERAPKGLAPADAAKAAAGKGTPTRPDGRRGDTEACPPRPPPPTSNPRPRHHRRPLARQARERRKVDRESGHAAAHVVAATASVPTAGSSTVPSTAAVDDLRPPGRSQAARRQDRCPAPRTGGPGNQNSLPPQRPAGRRKGPGSGQRQGQSQRCGSNRGAGASREHPPCRAEKDTAEAQAALATLTRDVETRRDAQQAQAAQEKQTAERLARAQQDHAATEAQFAAQRQRLEAANAEAARLAGVTSDVGAATQAIAELDTKRTVLETALAALIGQQAAKRAEVQQLTQATQTHQQSLAALQAETAAAKAALDTLQTQAASAEQQHKSASAAAEARVQALELREKELHQKLDELSATDGRLSSATEALKAVEEQQASAAAQKAALVAAVLALENRQQEQQRELTLAREQGTAQRLLVTTLTQRRAELDTTVQGLETREQETSTGCKPSPLNSPPPAPLCRQASRSGPGRGKARRVAEPDRAAQPAKKQG